MTSYDRVPATLRNYRVPERVIKATRRFLRRRGRQGLEGVVLWVGAVSDDEHAEVLTELIPPQVAYRSAEGVAVQIPDEVVAALIAGLPRGVFVLCRVHSHPGCAYHSEVDDDNMLVSHRGAISIVVPDFAREGLDLARCSVNELDAAHRWRELSVDEVGVRFQVIA